MGLGHKEIIVADLRQAAAARRSAVDRHEFAYLVAFADLGSGRFTGVFEVLRGKADRNEWIDMGFIADGCFPVDHDMGIETHPVA